jgi:hypothetical protein
VQSFLFLLLFVCKRSRPSIYPETTKRLNVIKYGQKYSRMPLLAAIINSIRHQGGTRHSVQLARDYLKDFMKTTKHVPLKASLHRARRGIGLDRHGCV